MEPLALPYQTDDKELSLSSCTSHCEGQCTPACTDGGHCVANISTSKRPTRQDMLEWLKLKN